MSEIKTIDNPVKILGDKLRKAYSDVVAEPISWPLIDALCHLEDHDGTAIPTDERSHGLTSGDADATTDSMCGHSRR